MTFQLAGPEFAIYPGVSQYPGRHWLKTGMARVYGVNYTHAWIGFKLNGLPLIYQSTGSGVAVNHWENFVKSRIIRHVWRVDLDSFILKAFANDCFMESGKSYSNKQLFTMAALKGIEHGLKLVTFGHSTFKFKRYPAWLKPNRNNEHVCSETAGRMLQKVAPLSSSQLVSKMLYENELIGGIDADLFSPVDFFEYCTELEAQGTAEKLEVPEWKLSG